MNTLRAGLTALILGGLAAAGTVQAQPTWGAEQRQSERRFGHLAAGERGRRPDDLPADRVHERLQAGAGAGRDPGRNQEQQRDVRPEVPVEQHRRLRRDRAHEGELPGARALQPRAAAERVHPRLQPRRPEQGARLPRHGQAAHHQVRREVRHPQDRAGRGRAAGVRRPALGQIAGILGAFAGSRGGAQAGAIGGTAVGSVQTGETTGVWRSACATRS